eukprot:COSAG02_NODE_3312_length_6955_cov_2.028151_3_plen_111_part_00
MRTFVRSFGGLTRKFYVANPMSADAYVFVNMIATNAFANIGLRQSVCRMSEHAKQICKHIVAAPGVDVTENASWSPENDLGAHPGWRFWREPETAKGKAAHGVGSVLAKL